MNRERVMAVAMADEPLFLVEKVEELTAEELDLVLELASEMPDNPLRRAVWVRRRFGGIE